MCFHSQTYSLHLKLRRKTYFLHLKPRRKKDNVLAPYPYLFMIPKPTSYTSSQEGTKEA
jgi:hypothetical protein